ncbi:MAG: hypothetical protein HFJ59_01775 [Clostridia bacterium]|nr:hypothetical protein [Clostridia bacterium]
MTEQLLWNAVKEAQEKEQIGLLIWANWTVWDNLAFDRNKEMNTMTLLYLKFPKEKRQQSQLNGMDFLCLELLQFL